LDGLVRSVNGSVLHPLSKPLSALVGRSVEGLPHELRGAPETLARDVLTEAAVVAESKRPRMFDFFVGTTAQHLFFEWRMTYLDPSTVLCVVRDLTEKRRLEMQVVLGDRMWSLGTLAASMTHEINNPLTSVIANLTLAQRSLRAHAENKAPTNEHLERALEDSERIRDVVAQLGTLSRSSDTEAIAAVEVRRLFESALRLTSHNLSHRAVVQEIIKDVPKVLGHEGRLVQVLVNLLVNAGQAMPDGNAANNRIQLRCYKHPLGVAIEVEDNGKGIPPEGLPRIFDPFYTSKPSVGMGLGLSICQRIVTELGGTIEVESTLGKGTLFRVLLPAATQTQEGAAPSSAPPQQPFTSRRLLIIDDNPRVGQSLKLLLSNHQVTLAVGGEAGLQALLSEPYDVVLCDLMMPGMDGQELFRRVQQARPGLERRIVFMTGGAFTASSRLFVKSVSNPFLEKPFHADQLERAIAEVG
jgi:signal transduction histidine kinase